MASPTESSLITRLENSNYKGLRREIIDYLKPFSDFITIEDNLDASKNPRKRKSQRVRKKTNKKEEEDQKLIRSLAKQYLSFISRALKVLPNRLSEPRLPSKSNGGAEAEELGVELFDVYKLCLDCLSCISCCLDCKPTSVHFQRIRLIHSLEAWGRYEEAEVEGLSILESLRSESSGKARKGDDDGQFLPDLKTGSVDSDLACLVVELVVELLKCAYKSQRKDVALYQRVLNMVDQVGPWLRVLGAPTFEKLHRLLLSNLYKCTLFMLGEGACFNGDLVHKFCVATLTEGMKSSTKDQFLKVANNICLSLTYQWANRPALIIHILQCLLDNLVCKCEGGLEYTVNDFLDLVHYCVKKCRLASKEACNVLAQHLESIICNYIQILAPIGSILRFYAAGLHSSGGAFWLSCIDSENSVATMAIKLLLDDGEDLLCLAPSFGSLTCHFHIDSNKCTASSDYWDMGSESYLPTVSDSHFSVSCKNKHGRASFLSYLNALAFFCQPFAELINKECRHIIAEQDFTISLKLSYIQDAFHHFCDMFLIGFSSQSREREKFSDILRIFLHVAVASFTVSIRADRNVQKAKDCIIRITSNGWIQSKEMKFLVTSLYNIGAEFYNTNQLKQASVPFELCCKASWIRVSLLCKKFEDKTLEIYDDWSEDTITGFVTEACAKSATHLDVLHQCGSPDVNGSVVNYIQHWSLAANLFDNLRGPRDLMKKWVKIMCKSFKDASEDDAPFLYSLLLKFSTKMSNRTIGIILEQELLAFEDMEPQFRDFSQKMQLKIINVLLLNIYVCKDYQLKKSLLLIKKGRLFRACGIAGLNDCIQCLSDAICMLMELSSESFSSNASIFHQLAPAYLLRALCNQEAQPNSEVVLEDVENGLKLWSQIDWSLDIHHRLATDNSIALLCCISDLLSLKGCLRFQYDVCKIIIKLLKLKNVPLEKCLSALWADRKLTHALCIAPVGEDFIFDLGKQFGALSDSISFWISCIKDSQPLLIGFSQKLLLSDFMSYQVGHCHSENLLASVTADEVKEVALTLMRSVQEPSSAFLAGYLYYDLSERFISTGQLLEALQYSREALHLRTRLLQKKFVCMFGKMPKTSSENEEATKQSGNDYAYLEILGSVATEVWPHMSCSWSLESCNLSPWNLLQCYLESILQLGTIHEAIGSAPLAEALLLQGKNISMAGLPVFRIAFESALGEIYCKKQLWDLAENELNSCKRILVDCSTILSCRRCTLTLEVSINQRIGDLTRRRSCVTSKASSNSNSSFLLDFYQLGLKKLNLPVWGISLSFSEEANHLNEGEVCSLKVEDEVSHVKKEPKNSRRPKKTSKNVMAGHNLEPESKHRKTCPQLIHNVNVCVQGTSTCNRINCWTCLLMKVMELGTMKDIIMMKWEFHRRRLLLRLLLGIGKVLEHFGKDHEIHQLFWQSISVMFNRKPICGATCSIPCTSLLDLIAKESKGDGFSFERAEILFQVSRFFLKNYHSKCPRISCCNFCAMSMENIVSWLLQAFVLCRELPLLFQKVSRLLSAVYSLSISGKLFDFHVSSGKVLSIHHWAAFFHQASVGTYLNHQFLSDASGKLKICNYADLEGSRTADSNNTVPEAHNLLRLAPETIDNLEQFMIDFFQGLPCIAIICISLLGNEYAKLFSNFLHCTSSSSMWMLLSRFRSNGEPIVMLLPADLIVEDLDSDANSGMGSIDEGWNSSKRWLCPWNHTVVDDVTPQFKMILEENYRSSSISPLVDTQENRLLWWTWRRKLNDRLDKLLRDMEDYWFGPWTCLLLGEPLNCEWLDTALSKLISDLRYEYEIEASKELLRVILGGARCTSEAEACILELVLNKGRMSMGKHYQAKTCGFSATASNDECIAFRLSDAISQLIYETASRTKVEGVTRQPVVLVLDSDVQMLPWENIPVLRRQEVYRMPSIGSISVILNINCHARDHIENTSASFPSIDPLDAFYLLNPSGDLERTQVEFEEWFRKQNIEGKAGTAPTAEELASALKTHDLFIYFGHGSGTQYIHGHEIQKLKNCAATFLMGCSSGSLSLKGAYNPQGAILSYLLAGSPAIIANLWEVTDKDIDRFGKAMLNAWLHERSKSSSKTDRGNLLLEEFKLLDINNGNENGKRKVQKGRKPKKDCQSNELRNSCGYNNRPLIASFMSQAREACTLPFLIGASPVCYGVPTGIRKKKNS